MGFFLKKLKLHDIFNFENLPFFEVDYFAFWQDSSVLTLWNGTKNIK